LLIIRQDQRVHAKIKDLLEMLRQAQKAGPGSNVNPAMLTR
jgi:hypothetical protein